MARLSRPVDQAYRNSNEGVLEWAGKVSNVMTRRAYSFALPFLFVESVRPPFPPDSPITLYPAASLLGLPNELLTMILSHLTAKDLFSCAQASIALSSVAARLALTSPWKTATSPPISYADAILIDVDELPTSYLSWKNSLPWPPMVYCTRLSYWCYPRNGLHMLYEFPGSITQFDFCFRARILHRMHGVIHRFSPEMYAMHYPHGQPTAPEAEVRKWLDFTQLGINPFFEGVFGKRIRLVKGKIEIELQPFRHGADALFDLHSVPEAMVEVLRGMQISYPPVASVGIYAERIDNGGTWTRIAEVHVASGITLGDLLGVLRAETPGMVREWAREVKEVADKIRQADWVSYQQDEEKERVWGARASPVFGLVLDHENFGEGGHECGKHFTRKAYVHGAEKSDVRGYWGEWDREVFKGELEEWMGKGDRVC